MTESNPHEENARLYKAMRLANWIEANVLDPSPFAGNPEAMEDSLAAMERMPKLWWKGIAGNAGTHEPGSETRAMVVQMLRDRLAEKQKRGGRSPLEGLSGPEGWPLLKGCSE